ncbi:MAG: tetratricopeptide repeat protein [Halioglobus sp.]
MLRLPALAILYALLVACAAQTPVTPTEVTATPKPAAKPPERPFTQDSLYSLLVAEFALRRHAYDITLDEYMAQAPLLRDPGVSEHTTHLAQFLQKDDAALQSARLWVELAPDNAEANNTLAGLLARQGRTLEALPYLAVVERQTGSANFPMLLNGFGQLTDEQRDLLVQGIDKLSAEFPQNTRLLLTQALIHAEYQQYDLALDDLDKLFKLDPEQPQAVLLEARILIEQNADNPYARLQRILKENPDAKLLRLQYARLLAGSDMNAAREQFEILSEQSPGDSDLLFSLALISRETGDPVAARSYLRQTIALGQREDEAYYYLGRMAEDENEPEEAIANYMLVRNGPEYLAATDRIGQLLIADGQQERSHDWFNQQREANPEMQEQLYGLEADILTRAGKLQDALATLDQGLAETPDSTSLLYGRAMLLEQMDDLVGMERDLRTILKADPDNATALNALGYTLADRTRRYEEAMQLISRALELQPDEPAILDSMGWVLFRTGHYDDAVVYLSRAYADFPDPEVAAHLGEVLWVKGDTEAAISVWQGALLRDPDHPVLLDTLERLEVTMPEMPPSKVPPPVENRP